MGPSGTSSSAWPPFASQETGTETVPTESCPVPGSLPVLPMSTLIRADRFSTSGNTRASSIHTGVVARSSIAPTMPFQAASRKSETEWPSGR